MNAESRLLAAARQPVDALEQRLARQMERLRSECEQARAAMVKRLEARVAAAEAPQKKMEQRLLEVFERYEHLTESVKQHTGRMDLLDNRQTEWRRQMEDKFKAQQAGFDRRFQSISSSSTSATKTTEESLTAHRKRLSACEECLEENLRHGQEFSQAFAGLSRRLLLLETRAGCEVDPSNWSPQRKQLPAESSNRFAGLDDSEMQARLQSLEEHFRELQTQFDSKSWPSKCHADVARMVQHSDTGGCGSGDEVMDGFLGDASDDHPAWKLLMSRLSSTETSIEDLSSMVTEMHSDTKIGAELSVLVQQLQEIAPKVIQHERQLQMHISPDTRSCDPPLAERVHCIEAACEEAKGRFSATTEVCEQRLSQLERETQEHKQKAAVMSEQARDAAAAGERAISRTEDLTQTCEHRLGRLEQDSSEHRDRLDKLTAVEPRNTCIREPSIGKAQHMAIEEAIHDLSCKVDAGQSRLRSADEVMFRRLQALEEMVAERRRGEQSLSCRIEDLQRSFAQEQASKARPRQDPHAASMFLKSSTITPVLAHSGTITLDTPPFRATPATEQSTFFNAAAGLGSSPDVHVPGHLVVDRIEEHCRWLESLTQRCWDNSAAS